MSRTYKRVNKTAVPSPTNAPPWRTIWINYPCLTSSISSVISSKSTFFARNEASRISTKIR